MNKKTTMGDVKINPGIPSGTASPSSNAVVKFPKKRDPIFANPDVFLTPVMQLQQNCHFPQLTIRHTLNICRKSSLSAEDITWKST